MTQTPGPAQHRRARRPRLGPDVVRPEIQALRAVAVLGVVLFHLWPNRLSGGFVGVDVFFVVSGFLITDHLLREVDRSGRIDLPAFWARRVRRLLPASFLTIAASAAAVYLWVPGHRWPQFGREVIASTFYVENWELARQSVDYMAQANATSPLQHFWSLGVEEQFYLVWPVLIVAAIWLARGPQRRAVVVGLLLGTVAIVSLVHSIWFTEADAGRAYFFTTTRAWEFAAGGLLAWAVRHRGDVLPASPSGHLVRSLLSWGGLAAVVVAMLTYGPSTPFPGYTAALPVLGTVAVMAAGAPRGVAAPTRLMSLRPVQFVGDVSYGVYLWHWPLIIVLPYVTLHDLTRSEKLALLAASIVLGWVSKRFVEDPVRRRGARTGRPQWRTFALVGAVSAALVVATLPQSRWQAPEPPGLPDTIAACHGADAMADSDCADPWAIAMPEPVEAYAADQNGSEFEACANYPTDPQYRRCDLGRTTDPQRTIAVLGDSHATNLAESLAQVAEARGWRLSTFLVTGCPVVADTTVGQVPGYVADVAEGCLSMSRDMIADIVADPSIDVVVTTNRTRLYGPSDKNRDHPLRSENVAPVLTQLREAGKQVVVLRDHPEAQPYTGGVSTSAVDCLLQTGDPLACATPRADAVLVDDPMQAAAAAARVDYLDVDDLFCDVTQCHVQIGGLVVFVDDNHLTRSFAWSLNDELGRRLDKVLAP